MKKNHPSAAFLIRPAINVNDFNLEWGNKISVTCGGGGLGVRCGGGGGGGGGRTCRSHVVLF